MCFRELKELYVTFYTMVKLEGKKCFHQSSFFQLYIVSARYLLKRYNITYARLQNDLLKRALLI